MTQQSEWDNARQKITTIPTGIYVLTGCVAVIGSNSLVLGPIAPSVAQSFASSVPAVVNATALFGLGAATSALFLAHHIDRYGPARILKWAMMLLPLTLLLSAIAPWVGVLMVAQLFAGIASGLALPAIYTTTVGISPPGQQSKMLSLVLTGWTLSMVAGVSLSAILADLVHWRAVYACVTLLALVALLSLDKIKQYPQPASSVAQMPLTALRLTGIKPLLFAVFTFMTAFYGLYGYLGDYLLHGLGQPISVNGLVTLFYGVGFGCAALFERFIRKFAVKKVLSFALLLVATTYLLFAVLGNSLAMVLALLMLLGFANQYGINLLIVRLTAISPEKRGAITGLYSAVTNLAVFVGTSSFGPLYTAGGFATLCYMSMTLAFMASLSSMLR